MRAGVLAGVAAGALLLAGCGSEPTAGNAETAPTVQQIENLAVAQAEPKAGPAAARLEPLVEADLTRAGFAAVGCDLTSEDGALWLVAAGDRGLAKIRGTLVPLRRTSQTPLGAGGGFFEADAYSVSVAPAQAGATPVGPNGTSWNAQAVLSDRLTSASQEVVGIWSCERPS